MERVIFPCDEEEKIVSSKDVIEKIINQSEEVLINKIKEKSSLINEYKPSYKYGRLAILSLGINRKVKREFIRIIEQTFVVSNDVFREDRVLKNNSIFKAIKGEFAI